MPKELNSGVGSLTASARKKLKVGIRWAGRPDFEHQQLRLFPPEILTDLPKNDRVQFYSFQRDDNLVELPPEIVDLGPYLKEWDDTAAALHHMDLMISSCTSVAHLSAAMGKETWVMVPTLPYFPWALPGEKSVWYQSATVIRQSRFGDWESARAEVRSRFDQYLNERQLN